MYFSFSRARLSALAAACLSAISAQAQSEPQATLGEVVVTASRNPQLLSSTSAHTTLISRDDIVRSQATDLVSLLQREAGLQRTQNGGIGTASTLFLRGMPSLDTLVLIDGVPQTKQDASGVVSLEHILLDNVERVEIVRGNVSAIYGSGAIGGVIQIFTRTGGKEPSATVSLEIGPRNTAKTSAYGSTSVGNTFLSAGLTRLTTDGFSAINPAQFPNANPDADGYQNVASNLSMSHKVSSDHRFGLQLTQSNGNVLGDSIYGLPSDTHRSTTHLNQVSVFSEDTFGTWRSHVSLSEQSEQDTYVMDGSYAAAYGYNTRTDVLRWVNTVPIGDYWLGTAGLEEQSQHVDTASTDSPIYDKNRLADAVFIGMEGCFGAATVQLNVRNDRVGDLQKDTGYLGLGYSITDALKINLSTSTAFNAPPLGYLYDPWAGNTSLKPETANSSEVGLQWNSANQLLRATYFDTRIQDQLIYDFSTSTFGNVSQARNTGLELSYRASLGTLELRGSLTQQNPVDELTGHSLDRRSKSMASLGVSKDFGVWRTGADLRYVGDRNDSYTDPASGTKVVTVLGGYSVLDLSLAYRLSPQVLLTARLDNAFDEKYQTIYGYNQQPVSLYAGVTWSPKL